MDSDTANEVKKLSCYELKESYHWPYGPATIVPGFLYRPSLGDIVVGVVTAKYADAYKVNIRSASEAMLPCTNFLNSSRQHHPSLQVGSVVLCGVSSAHKDYETTLTCISCDDTKGWSSGEYYLGELKDGFWFDVSLAFADVLLGDNCLALAYVGSRFKCEVAVGKNGRVWAGSESAADSISIANFLKRCESITSVEKLAAVFDQSIAPSKDSQ